MFLIIFINDENNEILKFKPSEESFESSLGEILCYNDKYFNVIDISQQEFSDYELIIEIIKLVKIDKESIDNEFDKSRSI